MEEMESYTKQVEEFATFGDMSEIQRYLRKAQSLDNKLQAAAEKVRQTSNVWIKFCIHEFWARTEYLLFLLVNLTHISIFHKKSHIAHTHFMGITIGVA